MKLSLCLHYILSVSDGYKYSKWIFFYVMHKSEVTFQKVIFYMVAHCGENVFIRQIPHAIFRAGRVPSFHTFLYLSVVT